MLKLNKFWFFMLTAIITSIVYYFQHIRTAEFVFEDSHWIILDFYKWTFHDFYAIPGDRLTLLTFMHNTPKISHSINLIIHIINGLLLSLVLESWFSGFGWIAGSLFLVNPLATQSVAYSAGRGEMLALIFLFGFLWFSTISKMSFDIRWIFLQLCLLGIAVTKATVLVIAIPLLIWVYISDSSIEYLEGLEYLILAFFLAIPFLLFEHSNIIKSSIPTIRWFAVQSYAVLKLSFESLTGKGLAIDHAWWLASQRVQILSALSIIIIFIIVLIKRSLIVSFGIGWYLISFSPRLLAHVNLGWIREHHAYVPLVGLCIALASLLGEKKCSYENQ